MTEPCTPHCPHGDCAGCAFPRRPATTQVAAAALSTLKARGHLTATDLLRGVRALVPGTTIEGLYLELVSLEAANLAHIAEPWHRKWGAR